jgi:ABC-2 type transport system ATP-binding protein
VIGAGFFNFPINRGERMMMMDTVIRVKGLRKVFKSKIKHAGLSGSVKSLFSPEYREVEAVSGIDMEVRRGEVLAFLGPNGAGKSTTIKILTGILQPSAGELTVLGYLPGRDRKKLSFKIGSVFGQKSQLWFHLPPIDSFKLLGAIYELEVAALDRRIAALIEIFELEDLMKTPVRKLSLGQRMRCEFAASILHRPELIFLDEPTIGLDVVVKQKIRELILRLNREEHTTIFLTSHDVGDIEQMCKRAVIINHGRIVLDSPVKSLKYGYLKKKIIDVKFSEMVDLGGIAGLRILRSKGPSLKLEVEAGEENLHQVMKLLIHAGNIEDLTISDIPMEEIIAAIYHNEGERNEDA